MNGIGEWIAAGLCGVFVLGTLGFIIWFVSGPMAESLDDE